MGNYTILYSLRKGAAIAGASGFPEFPALVVKDGGVLIRDELSFMDRR